MVTAIESMPLRALQRAAQAYRASLIRQFADNDLDRDELTELLSEVGLPEYGATSWVRVTVSFRIGLEDTAVPDPGDFGDAVQHMFETIQEDMDLTVLEPDDGYDVQVSLIQKDNLPS